MTRNKHNFSKTNYHLINDQKVFKKRVNLPHINKTLASRAKSLRKAGNLPEVIFWKEVSKSKFHGIDFDRQKIIGNYIVDFYVRSLGMVIEIDGSSHNDKELYDLKREAYLTRIGLVVYRISAQSVEYNVELVLWDLEEFILVEFG